MIEIMSFEREKKQKLDVSIGIRLPKSIRDKARQLAKANSDETTKVTESAIYRSIIVNALSDQTDPS